jgi:hypothetical protein
MMQDSHSAGSPDVHQETATCGFRTKHNPIVDLFSFTGGLFMDEVSIWFLLNICWDDKLIMNGKLCAGKQQEYNYG